MSLVTFIFPFGIILNWCDLNLSETYVCSCHRWHRCSHERRKNVQEPEQIQRGGGSVSGCQIPHATGKSSSHVGLIYLLRYRRVHFFRMSLFVTCSFCLVFVCHNFCLGVILSTIQRNTKCSLPLFTQEKWTPPIWHEDSGCITVSLDS